MVLFSPRIFQDMQPIFGPVGDIDETAGAQVHIICLNDRFSPPRV
jgi:hypothetical protein